MMIQAQQATLLPPPASGFWSSTVPHCGLYSVSLVASCFVILHINGNNMVDLSLSSALMACL